MGHSGEDFCSGYDLVKHCHKLQPSFGSTPNSLTLMRRSFNISLEWLRIMLFKGNSLRDKSVFFSKTSPILSDVICQFFYLCEGVYGTF